MSLGNTGLKLFSSKAISTVVLFFGLAYFARELSPAIMGSFFLFRTLTDGAGLFSDFGIRSGVQKRLSEKRDPSRIISTGLALKSLPVLGAVIAILAFRSQINGYLGAPLAPYLAAAIVVREMGWYFVNVLRGELRVDETALVEASRLVVWIAVSVALLQGGYGVLAVVYGYIAGLLALGLLAFLRMDTLFGRPTVEDARSIVSYSKYDFVSKMNDYLYNWLDIAIIGFFLTQTSVGIYEYAWQMTLPIALIMETIVTVLFPQISRWHSSQSGDEIPRVVSQAVSAGLFVAVPAFVGGLLLAEPILMTFFGSSYVAGATVLVILMGEKVVRSVQAIFNTTLCGIDEPKEAALVSGATLLANLSLNVVLVPRYGIEGAAVATFSSVCLSMVLHWHYLRKYISVEIPLGFLLKVGAVATGMGAVVFAAGTAVTIDTLPELLGVVLLGVVTYLGGTTCIPSLREAIVRPFLRSVLQSEEESTPQPE